MKILIRLAGFLLLSSILGCDVSETRPVPKVVLSRSIVPRAEDVDAGLKPLTEEGGLDEYSRAQYPKVPIEQNEALLRILNVNLDLDKTDEQILVLKDRDDPLSPIEVAVVDFDEIRASYFRTWQHRTLAMNQRAFRIELEDIVGDYNNEIICRGLNKKGELTLDIFRKTTSPSGMGLYFSAICRLTSDRRIEIERYTRSQAYEMGQKYGQSFPISVERKDPASGESLDVIRETYYWKFQEKKYVKSVVEKIPGDKLMQKQLRELFSESSSKQDFKEFLDGPWYKQNKIENLVLVDSKKNMISFYESDILETYVIEDLYIHGYSLSLITRNSIIGSIKKWIICTIRAPNRIEISSSKSRLQSVEVIERWVGTYHRLTPDLRESFFHAQKSYVRASDLELSGIYKSSAALEIAFEPPYFAWIEDSIDGSSGGFSILEAVPILNAFYIGRQLEARMAVITFRFLKESGLPVEDRTYLLEFAEKKEENTVSRSIILTPAHLTVNGAFLTSRASINLEQVEIVD